MLALTLHRPWPWAIFHLPPEYAKRVENRTWKPPAKLIGERFATHAGQRKSPEGWRFIDGYADEGVSPPEDYGDEGIIGTAILCGVVASVDGRTTLIAGDWPLRFRLSNIGGWFLGPFGWLLDDVRRLPEPIPCKGAQGLWRVPDEIAARLA